jgi:hypothetical protein
MAHAPQRRMPSGPDASDLMTHRNVLRSTRPRLTFSVPMTWISTRKITMTDLSKNGWSP